MAPYIIVDSNFISPDALKDLLLPELVCIPDIHLKVRRFRSMETAILVAIVGSIGTGLGALITGILKVVAQKGVTKIVLQGRSGRRIEVPSSTPTDKINEYVQIAKDLDIERITINTTATDGER